MSFQVTSCELSYGRVAQDWCGRLALHQASRREVSDAERRGGAAGILHFITHLGDDRRRR